MDARHRASSADRAPRAATTGADVVPAAPTSAGLAAFGGGAIIGTLGGLIGLGGAEFRLPLLIGPFRFHALEAVILNKAMSLVVVATALPFRARSVPFDVLVSHWSIVANLLAGSLFGAWFGAGYATRLKSSSLYRVIAVLLVGISLVLLLGHGADEQAQPLLTGPAQVITGIGAGLVIGVVASILGVAGGELLIPTLVLLFGADIKLAGSLSLAVSLPTVFVGFTRYSRDRSFSVLGRNLRFVVTMAAGSIAGAFVGGRLLGVVPHGLLLPLLSAILLASAVKVWRHR
ncbi:sulfite exporter TauE/SafE family protein [Candidatus Binatia bacterium]|nr:sulfite exporter TauE/SafE family protein [Candidatus Binatia bacterium]